MRLTTRLLSAAIALFASPALAQEAPLEAQGEEVVVTGTRDREKQVREFVTALTPAPQGSIARFIDQVCPLSVGLVPAQNAQVVERLRKVARAAGMTVAPADCTPNMFVIVTPEKRPFIEALAKRQPDAFALMRAKEVRRLARSPGPAAAWQLEGPVDSSGVPIPLDSDTGMYVHRTTGAASRLRPVAGRGFDASVVVVETGAIGGLTLTQLADYAAMRLLAKLDPARLPPSSPPTILAVLDAKEGAQTPVTLTRWDLGLLRGLSAGPMQMAGAQRSTAAREIAETLEAASPDE